MFFLDNPEAKAWSQLMVQRMATIDPMKGLDAILALKVAFFSFIPEDLELIFANLSQQDPSQIPAALARMEANGIKSGEQAWMLTLAKTDPEAVFQYLIKGTASIDDKDLETIAKRLGQYAPEKAVAAIYHYGSPRDVSEILSQAMHNWFQRDPSAAKAYAMNEKDASLIIRLNEANNSEIDYSSLRQIFSELKSTFPTDRATLASHISSALAEQDIDAARQWASTPLPTEKARSESIHRKTLD